MNRVRVAAAMSFCASTLLSTGAIGAPLDLKLGLWESTFTSQSSGEFPAGAMNLSPEQKAQIQALMRSRQAQSPMTKVYKSCLTKKQLNEDPAAEPPEPGESCSTKIDSQSSKHWKGKRVCTKGTRRREFEIDIRALSRERTTGTVKVMFTEGGQTMTVDGKLSGKWLSSDCGDVK